MLAEEREWLWEERVAALVRTLVRAGGVSRLEIDRARDLHQNPTPILVSEVRGSVFAVLGRRTRLSWSRHGRTLRRGSLSLEQAAWRGKGEDCPVRTEPWRLAGIESGAVPCCAPPEEGRRRSVPLLRPWPASSEPDEDRMSGSLVCGGERVGHGGGRHYLSRRREVGLGWGQVACPAMECESSSSLFATQQGRHAWSKDRIVRVPQAHFRHIEHTAHTLATRLDSTRDSAQDSIRDSESTSRISPSPVRRVISWRGGSCGRRPADALGACGREWGRARWSRWLGWVRWSW